MFIGISGGSGAGKTAFINAVKLHFNEDELGLISEDNYYLPKENQKVDSNGMINFDVPDAIDHEAFIADLHKLKKGIAIERKEYTFNNSLKTPRTIYVEPSKIYLVEGLFILHHEDTRELLSLSILIHAKENLKMIRRIKRDSTERNYPAEDVLYRYQHHVAPAYEKYISPYLDDLDIIINNNRNFDGGVDLLTSYIRSYLGR